MLKQVCFTVIIFLFTGVASASDDKGRKVVVVVGTHHYSPNKSMPLFAKELERLGLQPTVINPSHNPEKGAKGILGLEALADADLAIFFTRFLKLPDDQLKHITSYLESGKPVYGLRTSGHGFNYPKGHPNSKLNDGFGRDALGSRYLIHLAGKTKVKPIATKKEHPILTGVTSQSWDSPGTLYLTDLQEGAVPLIRGTGNAKRAGKVTNQFGTFELQKEMTDVMAWTWTNKWGGRTFFSSLGHTGDFAVDPSMRIMVNGVFWALDIDVPSADTKIETFSMTAGKKKKVAAPTSSKAKDSKSKDASSSSLPKVKIENDSMTILYGNSLIEKLQEEGTFEATLHASSGEKHQFRSMAYVGDQVHFRIRPEKFGNHKSYLVDQWPANRVIMAFGGNEAHQGAAGVDKFNDDLNSYLDIIIDRHPDSQYILCSPIAAEKNSQLLGFDATKRNENLSLYTQVMTEVAKQREIKFVDLYQPTLSSFNGDAAYTYDGIHLNDSGASVVGAILATAIAGDDLAVDASQPGFVALKQLVGRKAYEVAQAYHPSNGISYYGTRQRTYEYLAEIPHHLKLANDLDKAIWKQARNLASANPMPKLQVLRTEMPSREPRNGLGVIKSSKEDLEDFEMAKGYEVNCFASSEDFPELINPLQIQFDTKGRLWVTCYASYPHPLPGQRGNDMILILEDTNNDGKADKRTVFADSLLLPDGFVLYKKGALVSVSKKLIYLEDTDGDGKADLQEEVIRGFDNTDTHHSGYLARSPGGDLIMSEALFHRGQFEAHNGVVHTKDTSIMTFDLATRHLLVERQTESPNPWKVTHNRYGAVIQFYGGGQIIDADIHNIYTPMGQAALTELGMPFRYDKGCSAEFLESPHFPKEWQGGLLTSHLLRTNEINFTPLNYVDGAIKSAGERTTLIKSANKIFRPSDLIFGPDGALFISDFYYPIIGHAQHSNRDKLRDYSNGRVWRVTRTDGPILKLPDLAGLSTAKLVEGLSHSLFKTRQLTRLELEIRPVEEVLSAIAAVEGSLKSDSLLALEILWLKERVRSFDDTSLINNLFTSKDLEIKRAAVRSLRKWASALGSDLATIVSDLAASKDERTKILLVGALSHLQLKDEKWSTVIQSIEAKDRTPLAFGKTMASWKDQPGMAPEFPLLKVKPEAYIASSKFEGPLKVGASLYIKSEQTQELVVGHSGNPFLSISLNDKSVLIPSGSQHTKTSQNTVLIQKGYNKLEVKLIKSKSNDFKLYICDKKGGSPNSLELCNSSSDRKEFAVAYRKQMEANWEGFAVATFKKHCANCHAVETKTVGPPLKGLFGKTQTVINSSDQSEKEITVDEAYLRQSIEDPMAVYPKGYVPAMVPLPISDKEKDVLIHWIKTL